MLKKLKKKIGSMILGSVAVVICVAGMAACGKKSNEECIENTQNLNNEKEATKKIEAIERSKKTEDREIAYTIDSGKHAIGKSFKVELYGEGVKKYTYTYEGVQASGQDNNPMNINIKVTEEGFGTINICGEYEDGEILEIALYTYALMDTVCISYTGKDAALTDCLDDLLNRGLISQGQWEDIYGEFSKSMFEPYEPEEE